MGQHGPKKPLKDCRGQRRPARKADCADPLEALFGKEKTKESGRICKRLGKGLDEVIQHAGSPFGDGGFNRFAQSAGPAFIRYWPRGYAKKEQGGMQPYTEEA